MRSFPRWLRFWTALVLLGYWTLLYVAPAGAALMPSTLSGQTTIASNRDADLIVVQRALENRIVAQKLRDYGVEPAAVKARLATASDQEIHQLATASKGLPSGSDDLGVLVTLLVLVILIIVIVKLMNKEIVIK